MTWKYGRPLVLKSPPHTARIKLLLEMFPEARFVHIHRNPYVFFQSTKHLNWFAQPFYAFQRCDAQRMEARILRQYREMYDAFFEERGLIPRGHFHEVGFEALEADSLAQMRKLYEALDLPDFRHVEPVLRHYLDSIAGYKKNTWPELPADVRARIAKEWRRCFEAWGYAT
jgi:LPS sulfotransferase NodH